jgi:RecB family endonuclease NucS
MLSNVALRRNGEGWAFSSEAAVEDFVWNNLEELLQLTPLKKQYPVRGEVCDILALNDKKQLIILELKNTEDRYVVQQLTRYFDNLLEEKPFKKEVDYSLPIHLIAAAPSFHKHNFIDRKYNTLNIDFLLISVTKISQIFYLNLENVDTKKTWSLQIPYQEIDIAPLSENVPEPPDFLLDWLGSCTLEEQQAILKLREKVLNFDERICETSEEKNTIRYQKSKTRPVSEIFFQKSKSQIIVFLWLPIPNLSLRQQQKEMIGRTRLWLNGAAVTHVGHVPAGVGKMKLPSEWDATPLEKKPRNYYHNKYTPFHAQIYNRLLQNEFKSTVFLESLVELARFIWLTRI